MSVVDAHHHIWDLTVRNQDWISGQALSPLRRSFAIAELEDEAAKVGVDASVLVQTVALAEETPELLSLAKSNKLVAGVVGWTDLTSPDVVDALARLREMPGGSALVGIRHQVQSEPDPVWLLRPEVLRGLDAVGAAGLVYDLVVQHQQLPAAIAAAAAMPALTFVLDHLGKPPIASGCLQPWEADLRALAALPNTVCKFSGMVTEANWHSWTASDLHRYTDIALEAFGPDRLIFGSDWPVCTLAATYREVLETAKVLTESLSPHETAMIFGATAIRIYGLAVS